MPGAVFISILLSSCCITCKANKILYAEVLPDLDNIIITRQEEANITCILTDDQGKCSGIGGWRINAGKVISPENPIQNGSFWTIKKPNSGYEETFIIIDGEKAPSQVKLQCIINGCAKYNKTIFVQEKPDKISYDCDIFDSSFSCNYSQPSNIIAIDEIQLEYINELKIDNQTEMKTPPLSRPYFSYNFTSNDLKSEPSEVIVEVTPVIETNYEQTRFRGNTVAIPIETFSASNCSVEIINKLSNNTWTLQAICHLDKELIPSSFSFYTKQGNLINCFNTSNLQLSTDANSSVFKMHGEAVLDDNSLIDLSCLLVKSDRLENVTFHFNLSPATISTYNVKQLNCHETTDDNEEFSQTCFRCEFVEGSIPYGCYVELLINGIVSENFTINETSRESCMRLNVSTYNKMAAYALNESGFIYHIPAYENHDPACRSNTTDPNSAPMKHSNFILIVSIISTSLVILVKV